MCIRDRCRGRLPCRPSWFPGCQGNPARLRPSRPACGPCPPCLLYTSDAADERSSVDLGGRRIIKKKNDQDAGVAQVTRTGIHKHEDQEENTKNE